MNHLILIPSYKPDTNLFNLIKDFLIFDNIKILVINNGNGKDYKHYFDEINNINRCSVIDVKKNFGKGYGIKKGIFYVIENFKDIGYVIFADADGQHTRDDIGSFLSSIKNLHKDYFLIGNRLHNKKTPLKNYLGNKIYNFILRKKFKLYIKDVLCGLRAIHSSNLSILLNIEENEFEFEVETVKRVYKDEKLNIKEVDISSTYFKNHKSHFSKIKDSFKLIKFIYYINDRKK